MTPNRKLKKQFLFRLARIHLKKRNMKKTCLLPALVLLVAAAVGAEREQKDVTSEFTLFLCLPIKLRQSFQIYRPIN